MSGPWVNRRQVLLATGALAATPPRVLFAADEPLRVVRTRTECIDRPLGLEVAQPRFSWALASSARDVRQLAYRILVASDPGSLAAGRADLWDSGKMEADRCFDVAYAGAPLRSAQRAWWSVQVWTHQGSATSEPSWFEMGLLTLEDWHGEWLAVQGAEEIADRAAGLHWVWGPKLRFQCNLSAAPSRAELFVAAKDHLQGVWVNGTPVSLPPSGQIFWGTMLRFPVQLRVGKNVVCVAAAADTGGFFPPDGGAVVALLKVTDPAGRVTRFTTGPDWRSSNEGDADWMQPDFDDRGWVTAKPSSAKTLCEPWVAQPAMLLRREFDVAAPVRRARLYATALGAYEARINGKRVGDAHLAPEISVASDHVFYQCHDVTDLVQSGRNAIGAMVGDGWYASGLAWQSQRYALGPGPRRFMAQLVIEHGDGSRTVIATDPRWRTSESAVRSSEIYNGEEYDARRESPGWDTAGFDASGWASVCVGARPAAKLIAQVDPPIRNTLTLEVKRISRPRPGVFVCDFGQNFSGWCRLQVKGSAGTAVTLRYAEILAPSGDVDMSNLRGARATDRYTLRGDEAGEVYEPRFTYHGFRYVEVTGFPGEVTADVIRGVVVHSDTTVTGELQAGNEVVQEIWHNAFWSQRSNFFGVPTDCPQRDERLGWMGDIQVFLDAASFNMDVDAFIRRFMTEVRAGQAADQAFPIVTPQPLSFPEMVTSGWSDAGVILPWTLYRRYGETGVIEENWRAMEGWLDYIGGANPDFVFRHRRGLDLGDWLSVDAKQPADETTPRVLVATAYWAYCAALMEEMARATGRTAAATHYAGLRTNIGTAFAEEFVHSDGKVGNGSQTSYVLALRFDLVPAKLRQAAGALLSADIRRRGMRLSTGFLGTPYILDVLADTHQADVAVSLLLQAAYPSWGYMLSKGATTMWERWNGDVGDVAMNSYNHYAFGAVVGFMYRRLAGIAPAAPGFRRIEVNPVFDPRIGTVRARYESCLGPIATEVSATRLLLEVPPNCVATVHVRGKVLEVGSGQYDFQRGALS